MVIVVDHAGIAIAGSATREAGSRPSVPSGPRLVSTCAVASARTTRSLVEVDLHVRDGAFERRDHEVGPAIAIDIAGGPVHGAADVRGERGRVEELTASVPGGLIVPLTMVVRGIPKGFLITLSEPWGDQREDAVQS